MDKKMLGPVLMFVGAILVLAGLASLVFAGDDSEPAATPASSSMTTSTTTSTTSTTTTSTTTTTTVAVARVETPAEFLVTFLDAFTSGNAEALFSRLNQATIDRYGAEQCQAYTESVIDVVPDITLKSTTELDSWDYVTDEQSVALDGITRAEVDRVVNTQIVPQQLHWQLVNSAYTWFTDCGDLA